MLPWNGAQGAAATLVTGPGAPVVVVGEVAVDEPPSHAVSASASASAQTAVTMRTRSGYVSLGGTL
jgi:hypothetical protein